MSTGEKRVNTMFVYMSSFVKLRNNILYTHILLKFQDMENKIRNTLNEIYFGKTKDIVNSLRSVNSLEDKAKQANLQNELFNKLKSRSQQN